MATKTSTAKSAPTAADVRGWASEKGRMVSTRGRLALNVIEAYNKSHPRNKYLAA